MSSHTIGVLWSLTSAFLWSTTFVSARFLLAEGQIDPLTLSTVRFVLGGSGLLLVNVALGRRKELFSVARADLLRLAGLGLFGTVGMSLFLFLGQRSTTAINASLVLQVAPILILLSGVLIGETIRIRQCVGIGVGLLGCLLVVEVITRDGFAFDAGHLHGDACVLLSAACWAVYTVWGKPVVARLGGLTATTWAMCFGAIELLVLRLILPWQAIWPATPSAWGVVLYVAVFPTAIAFFAWYEAMRRIELALLNAMQYLTPVFTIALASLLLHERLAAAQWLGVALVLGGVMASGGCERERPSPDQAAT